jgi:hypothetical protein
VFFHVQNPAVRLRQGAQVSATIITTKAKSNLGGCLNETYPDTFSRFSLVAVKENIISQHISTMRLGMTTGNAYDLHRRNFTLCIKPGFIHISTGVQLSSTNHPSFKHWHFLLNAKKPVEQQLKSTAGRIRRLSGLSSKTLASGITGKTGC